MKPLTQEQYQVEHAKLLAAEHRLQARRKLTTEPPILGVGGIPIGNGDDDWDTAEYPLCPQCGRELSKHLCRRCKLNFEPLPEIKVKKHYGRLWLPGQSHETMLIAQDYKCKICKQARPLVEDHCHDTYYVRGLLCNTCNLMLGLSGERIETLHGGGDYIREFLELLRGETL